jgi:acetate---CoA ligase (ADP-forming)
VTNVKSLGEIPQPVDYVVVAVPRQVVPRVLADCAAARVGAVTAFTAGFSETADPEGERLEAQIAASVAQSEFAFVGPNCMGLANPRIGLCNFPGEAVGEGAAGGVSFLGQSGTHTIALCMRAAAQGVGVNKAASFGNGVQLDAADFLAYFAADDSTRIIAGYVEGVRRGRRFFEVLRAAAALKPVVLWKGGRSEAGQRAILSHTAALATANAVWDGMLRQAGAIGVDTLDELLDVVRLLAAGRRARGRRAGLIAMTGGPSVALTDACAEAGLEVPLLGEASYAELAEFFNVIGGSLRNPLDAGSTIAMGFRSDNLRRLLDVLDADPAIDLIAVDAGTALSIDRWNEFPQALDAMIDTLAEFSRASPKPCVVVLDPAHREAEVAALRSRFAARGIVTMASAQRAARALAKSIE